MRIYLEFTPSQTAIHRARITYAFRLFSAIYGHDPILERGAADGADVWLTYSAHTTRKTFPRLLHLSDLYFPRPPHVPAATATRVEIDGKVTALIYAPERGACPDWLGEIFEWVSCADEYSVRERDSHGRIRFADTFIGRHGLDARVPYAALAMSFLQRAVATLVPGCSSLPISPVSSVRHFVVATHDVDFVPVSTRNSILRLARNAAVSLFLAKRPGLAIRQIKQMLSLAVGGSNPLSQLQLIVYLETQRRITASYLFLLERLHRRDGNYSIHDPMIVNEMHSAELHGMEIGVHGSYTSLDDPERLAAQFTLLRQLGFDPQGGRQHWLRFTLGSLISAVERAGASYDASLGWSDRIGFRAGACFAFPPYNFEYERPARFLEIPLVMMDQALLAARNDAYKSACELLRASRQYGWGGVSVLWHPTAFGGGQLPAEIGDVFWRLADSRAECGDQWVSSVDFLRSVSERYARVGLLVPGRQSSIAEVSAFLEQ